MSCLPLPAPSPSQASLLPIHVGRGNGIVFYAVYLDAVERAGPTPGSAGLEVLFFQRGEGLEEWCLMLETPALFVCASPPSPLIPVSPCLTLGLEMDDDELCHELMGWDGTGNVPSLPHLSIPCGM